jgi:hypothetical protein
MSCGRTLTGGVAWQRRLAERGVPVDLARRAPGRDAQAERRGRTPRREVPAVLREFVEHLEPAASHAAGTILVGIEHE